MVNAGRVAIVPQGEWSADSTYKRLDAVTHNNTLYFAKKEVPAGTATSNTEYWSKSIAGGQSEITVDGTTITLDEAKGIISLAKTLQDKINTIENKLPKTSVVNNNTTTQAGLALDARQANPNIEGTMAANILQLNNDLSGSLNNIVFKDVSDKLDTDHVTGMISIVNIGKIVMVYFDILPKAVSDNATILPAGTIPNAYIYAYHSINTWGQPAIPDSLMAVRNDGSLAFWSGKNSIGARIYDSFIYFSR